VQVPDNWPPPAKHDQVHAAMVTRTVLTRRIA
jgi:hypothetical protein